MKSSRIRLYCAQGLLIVRAGSLIKLALPHSSNLFHGIVLTSVLQAIIGRVLVIPVAPAQRGHSGAVAGRTRMDRCLATSPSPGSSGESSTETIVSLSLLFHHREVGSIPRRFAVTVYAFAPKPKLWVPAKELNSKILLCYEFYNTIQIKP